MRGWNVLLNVDSAMALAKKFIYENATTIPVFVFPLEVRVYGWVLYWNALEWVETGLEDYNLLGNSLLLITKKGEVFGVNRRSTKDFLKEWEEKHGLAYLYPLEHGLHHLYASNKFPILEGLVDSEALENARKEYLKKLSS